MGTPHANEPDSRALLLYRFRCVAFAALGAGVTEDQLLAGVQVAVLADGTRRLRARPELRLVTDTRS